MLLATLGLNHKTAPVDMRERLAFGPDVIVDALRSLIDNPHVDEAVILSTCNRTELYCALIDDDPTVIDSWLSEFHNVEKTVLKPFLYSHLGRDTVQHLLSVASGLDSMVLGEPQILGQVKAAYQTANSASTACNLLGRLFQHSFTVAKRVRTDTAIGSSAVSVAFAAVSLARQIFSELSEQSALLIGAGETIELVARHLHQNGIGRIIIANRTVERAHQLARQCDGYAISLEEIPGHLSKVDIVISSTASPQPILAKDTVEQALKLRRHRLMLLVDIAVPRDIEPEVAKLKDVFLYTVDDLQAVIEKNMRSRQKAAEQALEIIEVQTDEFMGWLRAQNAVGTIKKYRSQSERLRDEVLEQALRQIKNGKSPEQVLQYLAHTLTNKLLHTPSTQIRQAGFEGQWELLEAANKLFELEQD